MISIISKLLSSKEGQVAIAVAAVYSLNAFLTGLKKAVDKVKDKTESKLDDEASDALGKALGVLSKVIEFMTANSVLLPPKAKAEVDAEKKGE